METNPDISGVNPFRALGGRESGPRNFRFEPKKIQIFREKFQIFQAKISDDLFLVLNSKNFTNSLYIRLSPQIFTFDTCILSISHKKSSLAKVSYNKKFSNILSVQNTL